jgi:hypothetical protein
MDRNLRPIPYPPDSSARRDFIQYLRLGLGHSYQRALAAAGEANRVARYTLMPNEKCEARTRMGTPCRCKAMRNGRCRLHGGMSTGPRI